MRVEGTIPFHLDRVLSRVDVGRRNSVDEILRPCENIRVDAGVHPLADGFHIRMKEEELAMILV